MNVPLAPELGLFLDKAFYDSYNTRWGNDREALDLDAFADQVAAFKARRREPHPSCHMPDLYTPSLLTGGCLPHYATKKPCPNCLLER